MSNNYEKLNFDSELMKPLKDRLQIAINSNLRVASITGKDAEINLKITVSADTQREFAEGMLIKEWQEPRLDFKLTEKIKESKFTNEGTIGYDYAMEVNEETNEVYINKVSKQIGIEDLEREED